MIKVYMDTNVLEDRSSKGTVISEKILSSKFYEILSFVSSNCIINQNVNVILTRICIDEIQQHIKETYIGVVHN